MIPTGSTFYATYRDVYDALYSAKQRVSREILLEFLNTRGVFVSSSSSREQLIEQVACLTHSYSDFEWIYNYVEIVPRAERTTSRQIKAKIDAQKLKAVVDKIREERNRDEAINLSVSEGGAVKITVEYNEFDHGKTILRQRRAREAEVRIFHTEKDDSYLLRYPANERIDSIVEGIISAFQSVEKEQVSQQVIDLSGVDKEKRTQFFKLLISDIAGYTLVDVIKVSVGHEIDAVGFSDASDDLDTEDLESLGSANEEEEELKAEVVEEVKSFLKKAALDGSGVLYSTVLQNFLKSGFFISRVVWQSIKNDKSGAKVELEAMLERPAAGKGFRYTVRAVYPLKPDGTHAVSRRKPDDALRDALLNLIEQAAYRALVKLIAVEQPSRMSDGDGS
jgi:hypothetical protein